MNLPTTIYGFVLEYDPPEGTLRWIPRNADMMLVYSMDGKTFREESVELHKTFGSDFPPDDQVFNKAAAMGKYKLDIMVRALFPRCNNATYGVTQ